MTASGFNPIRWNCLISGCFNYHRHFDIEHLAQCFPRNIGLTDLDGFVELNGCFLIVEFKARDAELTTGQRLAFERLSALSDRITIVVVRCDYRNSEIYAVRHIHGGQASDWVDCDLDHFIARLTRWADGTQARKAA